MSAQLKLCASVYYVAAWLSESKGCDFITCVLRPLGHWRPRYSLTYSVLVCRSRTFGRRDAWAPAFRNLRAVLLLAFEYRALEVWRFRLLYDYATIGGRQSSNTTAISAKHYFHQSNFYLKRRHFHQ